MSSGRLANEAQRKLSAGGGLTEGRRWQERLRWRRCASGAGWHSGNCCSGRRGSCSPAVRLNLPTPMGSGAQTSARRRFRAAAQEPQVLPGLTVAAAAAGRSTLIATIVRVPAGAVVLVPSLAVLYSLRRGVRGRDPAGGDRAAGLRRSGVGARARRRCPDRLRGDGLHAGVGLSGRQAELRQDAGREPGHRLDAVAAEGEYEQAVGLFVAWSRGVQVGTEGELAVGPGGDEPVGAPSRNAIWVRKRAIGSWPWYSSGAGGMVSQASSVNSAMMRSTSGPRRGEPLDELLLGGRLRRRGRFGAGCGVEPQSGQGALERVLAARPRRPAWNRAIR